MPRCPDCGYPLIQGYALLVCESCKKHWSDEFMQGYLRGIEDTQEVVYLGSANQLPGRLINNFAEKMRN